MIRFALGLLFLVAFPAGEVIEDSIAPDSASHAAPAGAGLRQHAPWRGVTIRLEIEAPGKRCLTLRSPDFDAYLVLRDAKGKVLAEDDDGFFGTHAWRPPRGEWSIST